YVNGTSTHTGVPDAEPPKHAPASTGPPNAHMWAVYCPADAQLRREHARPFWQVPADVQTVPSHDTSAPPSGNGVAAGHAPEQPPPWHVAQSTRKHPFVSCHVVSVCPPEPITVARSDHSHGWFSQYRPLDPGTRRKVTEPRQEAGAEESLPESRTAAGLSRLPSAAAKLPS